MNKLFVPLLVAVVLAGSGCTRSGEESAGGCKAAGDERAAKAVLRCTERSVAYVETEVASGTGVVVEVAGARYILTNQHVVDPFDAADATVGGTTFERLAVVGIDAGADIALLGPLKGSKLPGPLAIGAGTDLERGDEVFLVGYPGESQADDLEATISSGIVSRVRPVKEFDKTYLQTDASIGGGQSGGPLFDGTGRLVGISGLSFADEFALALVGRDVGRAMGRIVDGKGDDYLSVPVRAQEGKGATSGALKIHDGNDGQAVALPATAEDRTWDLTVDMAAKPVVSVVSLRDEEPLALSSNTAEIQGQIARELARLRGGRPEDLLDPSAAGELPKLKEREVAPGHFVVPVKAGESAMLVVAAPLTDSPIEVAWQSDLPLFPVSRAVVEEKLDVGGRIDRIFGGFDTSVDVLVDLGAGQEVELSARSPLGDPHFDIYQPGRRLDHLTVLDPEGAGIENVDDTDDGLSGLDATSVFTATTAGTHRLRVFSNEMTTTQIRFSVTDCAKADCDKANKPAG